MTTRDKILDAAEELIKSKGYNGFSYRDVSEVVGIKTASIHYHFATKCDLVESVVARYNEVFAERLGGISSSSKTSTSALKKFAELMRSGFADGEGYCLFAALASERNSLSCDVRDKVGAFFSIASEWLTGVFDQGVAAGELRATGDSESSASACMSLFEGALLVARINDSEQPLIEASDWLLRVVKP